MPSLRIYLLGPPRVELGGVPVEIRRRKGLALLAYLSVTGEAQLRDTLATLFWPERSQREARATLRNELWLLKEALGETWLDLGREAVALRWRADLWLDVEQFRQGLSAGQGQSAPTTPDDLVALTNAVSLYRDDFLTGFTLPNCPDFDEWQFFQAESLRQTFSTALVRLIQVHSAQGSYETALPYARRWLVLDPLHEAAHRQLMQLYAQTGQQAAALRQYRLCVQTFQEELDISPSPETTALYERIRTGNLSRGTEEQEGKGAIVSSVPPLSRVPALSHNLPPQPTPFIGREKELAEITQRLSNPACRLLTLVGPGGIGKTRLAVEAAAHLLPSQAFPDGIYFVPLAPLTSADFLVSAIAGALNFSFQGGKEPEVQLCNFLAEVKPATLLVLDNFEHLVDGVELLVAILQTAPVVKFLVTSRERLNLREEWLLDIPGLPFPKSLQPGEALEAYSAVQLFLQSTARLKGTSALSAADRPFVGRICQLVEGLPLGLELAAAWVRVLSCQEIAQEIEKKLVFLTTTLRDVPVRHRSLAAVFDHSWNNLSAEEKNVFRRLAVFQGGFWREAAEQIAGASVPILAALVDKSLLRRNAAGRFELHELLRQYGREKLEEAGEAGQIRDRHLEFFLKLAEEAEPHLRGADQATWLDRLELERDNLRAALEWSRKGGDKVEFGLRLAGSLASFWQLRGYFLEGREHLAAALAGRPAALERTAARAKALRLAGALAFMMSDYPATRSLLEESLAIYRELGPASRHGLADTLINFGDMETQVGNYTAGSSLLNEALGIMRELADVPGIAVALWQLGSCAVHPGDYERAVQYFEEALPLLRQIGDKWFTAIVLSGLAEVALRQGNYERAATLEEEALALRREISDKWGLAVSSGNLAWIALRQDDLKRAMTLLAESLTLRRELGEIGGSAWCLEKLAEIALTNGQRGSASRRDEEFQRAARLFGSAAALREPIGSVIDLVDRPEYERQLALVRAQLDEVAFAVAWAEGQAMTLEQAIEYALAAKEAALSVPVRSPDILPNPQPSLKG